MPMLFARLSTSATLPVAAGGSAGVLRGAAMFSTQGAHREAKSWRQVGRLTSTTAGTDGSSNKRRSRRSSARASVSLSTFWANSTKTRSGSAGSCDYRHFSMYCHSGQGSPR